MWVVIAGLTVFVGYLQWQINNISDYLEAQDYEIHFHAAPQEPKYTLDEVRELLKEDNEQKNRRKD